MPIWASSIGPQDMRFWPVAAVAEDVATDLFRVVVLWRFTKKYVYMKILEDHGLSSE